MKNLLFFPLLIPIFLVLLVSTIYCVKQVGSRGLFWAFDFIVMVLGITWFKVIGWRAIIPISISLVGVLVGLPLAAAFGSVLDIDPASDPGSTAP